MFTDPAASVLRPTGGTPQDVEAHLGWGAEVGGGTGGRRDSPETGGLAAEGVASPPVHHVPRRTICSQPHSHILVIYVIALE